LSIKSVDFARHPLSLILVTSPTCPYCLASKDFHRTVESESNSNDVPFYVAVPSKKNASGYLHELGFDSNRVKEWGDLNLAVSGTPTLIAVNENAIVKRVWVGQIPPDREPNLLRLIRTRYISDSDSISSDLLRVPNYSSKDLSRLKAHDKVSIVNTHERNFPRIRRDAIVIPVQELFFRAPNELDHKKLQLVDCSSLIAAQCQRSVEMLKTNGFRVATIDAGTYEQYCKAASVQ
jgi:hypothetical protein